MASGLEATFAMALKAIGCEMAQQVKFHPKRRWRLDFCTVDGSMVAVEIDGGEFLTGKKTSAHNRGVRRAQDYEKRNAAIVMGYVVFQFTGAMTRNDPIGLAKMVKRVIEGRRDD